MNYAVEAEGLTKNYGSTVALAGISFRVAPGEVVTLAGPNGAGKTTTVRIIGTQLRPGGGRARVLGHDVLTEEAKIRPHLACVPQEARPDGNLTPWEHVYYYLRARGMTRGQALDRSRDTLQRFGMWGKRNARSMHLSGGMRRRVLLAMAAATGTKILLLDEPTVGLDPVVRRETWDLLAEVKQETTILLTSHSMEEVAVLSDRIFVVYNGRVVAEGTPAELRRRLPSPQRITLMTNDGSDQKELSRMGTVRTIAGRPVIYPPSEAAALEVINHLHSRSLPFSVEQTTLEDAYVAIMEEHGAGGVEIA